MNFRTVSVLGGVSLIALTAILVSPKHAMGQTTADDDDSDVLEVIFVTARKRNETKLEIPVSVTAYTQSQLDERGITNAAQLSDFVPGFKFENTGQGGFSGRTNPSIRFRGVGVQVGSAATRAGALFWDGAYVADGIGIVPLIDLAQTEVVKGPQTAFFGRNTFAGAVNFIPAQANDEFSLRINAALTTNDDDSGHNVNAILNIPMTERLGARLALSSELRPGEYEFQDGSTSGEEETTAVLGSMVFNVTANTSVKYSGYFVDSEDTTVLQSISATTPAGECNRTYSGSLRNVGTGTITGEFTTDISLSPRATICGSVPEWSDSNINRSFYGGSPPAGASVGAFGLGSLSYASTAPAEMGSTIAPPNGLGNTYEAWRNHLSVNSELASGHTVSAFYSFGESSFHAIFDQNYGVPGFGDIFYTGFVQRAEDSSFEVRLSSPGDSRLRYTVGVSYYNQESFLTQFSFGPIPNLIFEEGDNVGVFGSLDYDLTDQLTLSLEGRWHEDTQTQLFNGPAGSVADVREQKYDDFMPRLIFSYQPQDMEMNIYGSVSQSFLQGNPTGAESYALQVPAGGINSATVGVFTPVQELVALELGIKQRVNDRFEYAAAIYNMDWDNQVFFDLSPFPVFASVFLPGDSEYTGLELEGSFVATDWLTFSAGFNYVDAELTDFGAAGSVSSTVLAPGLISGGTQVDATGNEPRYIPATSGSVSADFDLSSAIGRDSYLRVDVLYTGAFYIDNLEWNQVDASTKVNLRAGMQLNDGFRAEIFGTNIFDDRTFQASGGSTTEGINRRLFGTPTRGTEWGLRVTADF